MSLDFVEDLPPVRRGASTSKYDEMADQLRENPGKWAFIGRRSMSLPTTIRSGKMPSFPPDEFEAVGRNSSSEDKKADIFVRYVGTEGDHADDTEAPEPKPVRKPTRKAPAKKAASAAKKAPAKRATRRKKAEDDVVDMDDI